MYDLRFVARYVNQSRCTDLHYLYLKKKEENYQQRYIIGFVDDRSRMLLYYEKSVVSTSKFLEIALKINKRPKNLIISNGNEFTTYCFVEKLEAFGIVKHNIHPYTPQGNGKVDRFWYIIERVHQKIITEPNTKQFEIKK